MLKIDFGITWLELTKKKLILGIFTFEFICVLVIQKMYMKSLMGNGELSIIIRYHLNDLIIIE